MAEMRTVTVELGERSYPIRIGPGLLGQAELLSPHIRGRQVSIVTNETVAPLYLERLRQTLSDYDVQTIVLPDGEQYKTLEELARIYDALLESRRGRDCTLVALGGGVVGDMAGFAAATYLRGVDFIQIPTTLLSQVDSSVGGKTGVNRPLGKNMVGAFYQPRSVMADTDTLETLPERELRAGIAEVIKYALIEDKEFYHWLSGQMSALLRRKGEALGRAIEVSCETKARIVARDEREAGVRALLNLGHTFGHAIETATGYGTWLHGEAVAAGMVMAADLSWRLGLIGPREAGAVKALVESAGLPVVPPPEIGPDTFAELMSRDKKAVGGRTRFVVLEAIGRAAVRGDVPEDVLARTLGAGSRLAEPEGVAT